VTRDDCLARDRSDVLAPMRDRFDLEHADARGVIYLDGNSLGALPRTTVERVRRVVADEWGTDLIRSWNTAGWIELPVRVGDKIASLVGAGPGEVVVADSTSVNVFKALSAAVAIARAQVPAARTSPDRTRIVSERTNFPTDLYIAETLARERGLDLVLVDADDLDASLDERLVVLLLTHVNYRTGRLHPLRHLTRAAHRAGGLVVWDLAHSAGAVPVDLKGDDSPADAADFAVGCGYKYLNGGPGAPAFIWAHPRHTAWMDRHDWRQPLSGWLGHAAPFDFTPGYRPATGIAGFLCGTPPILSLAALECGVDVFRDAQAVGGLAAIRRKSMDLTDLFIDLVESRCAGHGLALVSPCEADRRGSQVGFAHDTGGYAIMQALIARGVIGDFRAPDILRFGFTPLYTRFVDVWDAADRLAQVLQSGEWRHPRFATRAAVT
jgi:kynureninase